VLEWALEPTADEPRVEGVVAVLDQHSTVREPQKCPPRIAELGRADEHRAVDVMPLLGVRVDRGAAVDERVEKGEGAGQLESLGADLEHQERGIAGGLNVDGDELRIVERRPRAQVGSVDGDLLPGHGLRGASWLEEEGPGAHRASDMARLAHAISSPLTTRRSSTAPA
jgi:hypothetical protein